MSILRKELDQYLDFRRKRGYALDQAAGMLESFVRFLEHQGCEVISTELCARWNTKHPASHNTMQQRAIAIRGFARWLRNFDLRHEVPPPYRGGLGKNRPKPHIYTDGEIAAILAQSANIQSLRGLRHDSSAFESGHSTPDATGQKRAWSSSRARLTMAVRTIRLITKKP